MGRYIEWSSRSISSDRARWRPFSWKKTLPICSIFIVIAATQRILSSNYFPAAVAVEFTSSYPEGAPPKASKALAQTLALLNPSSSTARALRAVEIQTEEKDKEPLPVCSQSKYLCQVHTLHSALPHRVFTHHTQQHHNDGKTGHNSALGVHASFRYRRLASLPLRSPKRLPTNAAKYEKNGKWPSRVKLVTPIPFEDIHRVTPSFAQVSQISKKSGIFLPLRVHAWFADFLSPLGENIQSNLNKQLNRGGEMPAAVEQPAVARDKSIKNLLGQIAADLTEDAYKATEVQHALRFNDIRRFFEVEVVPAALWWLHRTVRVDRLVGPLTVKIDKKSDTQFGVGQCGKCRLPNLRRLRTETEHHSLGIVEDADILLSFRTSKSPNEDGSYVCQVDDGYRPVAACISIPVAEAERLYSSRKTSFSHTIDRILMYIINAVGVNVQTLPFFLTWNHAWRKEALRRLHDANRVGLPPAVHAVTEVLNLDIKPSNSQKGFHRFKATATSSGASAETRTRRRFFLTTPEIKAAIRRYLGCTDVIGLELALYQSGPRFFEPSFLGPHVEGSGTAYAAKEELPMELLLAAMEDTGWYITEHTWAREFLWRRSDDQDAQRCKPFEQATPVAARTWDNKIAVENSFADVKASNPNEPVTDDGQGSHNEMFLSGFDYERCVKSMMELTPASRNRRNCHRITCVSDDDRIEAPMMLPVAKAVKWVAAQVTSKLQNGTEKTTVCMRGEKGQQKQVPGTERGVIECPDVDIVCHGRPCRNGGIPKYGVCVCKAGTFGRNCEYLDTERNRMRYPNRFSYGINSSITVLKGQFFAIPALIEGPHHLYFKPISKFPAGIAIDSRTGAIFGTPVEKTRGCVPLAIEVQMQEPPHAAERTFIRINVVDQLLTRSQQPELKKRNDLPPVEGRRAVPARAAQEAATHQNYQDMATEADWGGLTIRTPGDCEHYVKGDLR